MGHLRRSNASPPPPRPGPGEGVGGGVNPSPKGKKWVGREAALNHLRPKGLVGLVPLRCIQSLHCLAPRTRGFTERSMARGASSFSAARLASRAAASRVQVRGTTTPFPIPSTLVRNDSLASPWSPIFVRSSLRGSAGQAAFRGQLVKETCLQSSSKSFAAHGPWACGPLPSSFFPN